MHRRRRPGHGEPAAEVITLAEGERSLRGAAGRALGGRTGTFRVWLLTIAMALVAAVVAWLALRDVKAPFTSSGVPWVLVVAVLFYVAEAAVIHLHIGRSAHSFSMSEVPLILGLFFLTPAEFLAARFVGAGLALVVSRHQRSVKLAFNLSQFMLSSVVALTVFHLPTFGPPADILAVTGMVGPIHWVAALVATYAENFVGVLAVTAAISLAEGASQFRRIPEMLRTGTVVAMTNASLVLLALTVVAVQPFATVLFVIPLVTAFLAYRAYIAQRQQNEGLEMLYRSSRILQLNPQLDNALQSLLEHTRKMFRADIAEITLLPSGDPDAEFLRTTAGPGSASETMRPMGHEFDDPLLGRAIAEGHAILVPGSTTSGDGARQSSTSRFRNAMVAPLIGESRVVGTLVVANRLSDISTFERDDLKLFETLANHTAVALENGQLEQSLAALSELKEELHHQAFHDSLTGLANRALFSQRVEARLAELGPAGSVPVVIFLDLDDFKLVNDTLGHAAGDGLLAAVGERIRGNLRADDLASRIGGDEFAILVSDRPDLAASLFIAERLIGSFDSPYVVAGTTINVRASIGVAAATPDTTTADDLMRNADVAMYSAKAQGKGRIALFEPHMAVAVATRHQLTASLQRAVTAGEFVLNYQPIVEIAQGGIVGVEALVRWEDPARGTVWPVEFIPLAEESDVILRVGRWVLEQSCLQAKAWQGRFGDGGRPCMAVNISARQLKQPGFVDEVIGIVRDSGVEPTAIALEMTETAMLQDIADTLAKLRRLRDAGLGISVDDFGTGYSSLSYLQRFPVTTLKIARDFVHVDESQPESWELASAIVSMGRALHLEVVAEGVEHLFQLNRLRELGCGFAQGYYLARPSTAERIETLLGRSPEAPGRLWAGARPGFAVATPDEGRPTG
jgi:diguanylate cyclase (GGDEF)-like protein